MRYNVIQWVHRATRGWSYGGGVTDPRTGEMLKGHVTLGSLRIRQDRMIFEGLAGTDRTGTGAPDDPVVLSLARIRQLAAHEVGHTLGLSHNFAASTYAGRGSVMDYPAPDVGLAGESGLDFSNAYASGAGVWDVQAVRFAYAQYDSPEAERAGQAAILRENLQQGWLYMSDPDARSAGSAQPLAALWDNGPDPVTRLAHELEVRRRALAHFGAAAVRPGVPLGQLAEVLVPLYFRHRYQVEAAAKSVAGLDYAYRVRGDEARALSPVPAARQRAALAALLTTLDPAVLDLPESVLAVLEPIAAEYPPRHEFLAGRTTPAFDALGAAAAAAEHISGVLLAPERLARAADFHRRDPGLPGVTEIVDALTRQVFGGSAPSSPRLRAVRRAVQSAVTRCLLVAASRTPQSPEARAALEESLRRLSGALSSGGADASDRAFRTMLAGDVQRWLARAAAAPGLGLAAPDLPPGPPIGSAWAAEDCAWGTSANATWMP